MRVHRWSNPQKSPSFASKSPTRSSFLIGEHIGVAFSLDGWPVGIPVVSSLSVYYIFRSHSDLLAKPSPGKAERYGPLAYGCDDIPALQETTGGRHPPVRVKSIFCVFTFLYPSFSGPIFAFF